MERLFWIAAWLSCAALWVFSGTSEAGIALLWIACTPFFSWSLNFLLRQRLQAAVALPMSGEKGRYFVTSVTFSNPARLPTGKVEGVLCVRNELTGEQTRLHLQAPVPAGGSKEVQVRVLTKHCGYLHIWVEQVRVFDLFHLLPVRCRAGAQGSVCVLPDTFPMRVYLSVSPQAPQDSETYSTQFAGNDFSETFQLRDYVPGDSLRSVHWKLSGKLDRLVMREPGLPVTRSILVFWDKSTHTGKAEAADALAETAASLCLALCQQGLLFHLAWNDSSLQQLPVRQIDHTEDFYDCLPLLIRSHASGEESGCGQYLRELGRPRYARILYLAERPPADLIEFAAESTLTALLWDTGPVDLPFQVMSIQPDTYPMDLQQMELDG